MEFDFRLLFVALIGAGMLVGALIVTALWLVL